MGDLANVENALVTTVTSALYPSGVASAVTISPTAGVPCHVSRGWPDPQSLDDWLAAGRAWITVYPLPGAVRDTTRFPRIWQNGPPAVPTLTASVSGNVVTFGGTGGIGQVAGVAVGVGTTPIAYVYRLTAADAPGSVAAELAALVPAASASGAAVTLPTSDIIARVGADTLATMELRRQEQIFRICFWCPSPDVRDTIVPVVDVAISMQRLFVLPDGTATGAPMSRAGYVLDEVSRDGIYRRDIEFSIEYPTVLFQTQPVVLFPFLTTSVAGQSPANVGFTPSS